MNCLKAPLTRSFFYGIRQMAEGKRQKANGKRQKVNGIKGYRMLSLLSLIVIFVNLKGDIFSFWVLISIDINIL